MNIKIGADPELFVLGSKTGWRSAHNLVRGTKEHPYKIGKGAVQVDGTAAEFNIEPADTAEEFLSNITDVVDHLERMLDESARRLELREVLNVSFSPTVLYDADYFAALPRSVKILGCDPDLNAWEEEENPKPREDFPMRTGGGHIHIGWREPEEIDEGHIESCRVLTRQLDSVLYALSPLWDDNVLRRRTYGRMGSFRPKPYGCEYRPLSNAWVSDPELVKWVFNATVAADTQLGQRKEYFMSEKFDEVLIEHGEHESLIEYHGWLADNGIPTLPHEYLRP